MRVLLDTNIWVSALLFGGTPTRILKLAIANQIQIFSSESLLDELEEVLKYAKFKTRLSKLKTTAEELLLSVRAWVTLCSEISLESVPDLRDPDDVIVISSAIAAGAVVIVSGDNDLLSLKDVSGILIMTASQFLDRYFPDLESSQ